MNPLEIALCVVGGTATTVGTALGFVAIDQAKQGSTVSDAVIKDAGILHEIGGAGLGVSIGSAFGTDAQDKSAVALAVSGTFSVIQTAFQTGVWNTLRVNGAPDSRLKAVGYPIFAYGGLAITELAISIALAATRSSSGLIQTADFQTTPRTGLEWYFAPGVAGYQGPGGLGSVGLTAGGTF